MYVTYTRIYGWSDYGGESSYQPGYRLENMMWMTLLVYDYIIPGEKEVKDLEDWAAVQKVYKQTKSKRATAKILSISRNTVKRLLDMTEPPVYRRTEYSSKIDEYKERLLNGGVIPITTMEHAFSES